MKIVTGHSAVVGDIRMQYRRAGSGRPLVLLHGFPETSHMWREVMPAFADGHLVIAPDYRGAGDTDRPTGGYDKTTMAADIFALVDLVGDGQAVDVVGHDMGAFVAFAMAATRPDRVRSLCLIDAPVPGTAAWDGLLANPRAWHIGFHGNVDVALALVEGREGMYLRQFFDARAVRRDVARRDLAEYVRQYSAPGALRAAFTTYAELASDAVVNRELLGRGPLMNPTLVMTGEFSNSGPVLKTMAEQVSRRSAFVTIDGVGHWIVEEQPEQFVRILAAFLASAEA